MSERFFSSTPIVSEHLTLDGAEAHHLLHVMRAGVGQMVTLFDDSGAEFEAIIDKLGRIDVQLRIVKRREINRELPFSLTIGVALPKGDRQKWLVEKLTELGVTALVPLETERGVAQPTAAALDRLRRAVVEASKQCGRNRLMQIAKPQAWSEWIGDYGFTDQSAIRNPKSEIRARRLVAHPEGTLFSTLELHAALPTYIAIGPEGGFTESEVAAALAAGWQQIDLGPRILRVETAAIALAAAIAQCSRPSRS